MNTFNWPQNSLENQILVVDDIQDNSFLIKVFLEMEGYGVDVAFSGYEALTKIAENPPSLVLLDLMMPEMNGYEVMQKMRQDHLLPYIPVVLVTGCDSSTIANTFQGRNPISADGLIHKPVDLGILLSQVQALLV